VLARSSFNGVTLHRGLWLIWPTLYIAIDRPTLSLPAGTGRAMDRRRKVELFEQIRREYRFGVGTIRGVAKQFGVHRRIVRQAMESAVPPERKVPMRSQHKLEPENAFNAVDLRAS